LGLVANTQLKDSDVLMYMETMIMQIVSGRAKPEELQADM
jgi:hypothetical protein